MLAGCLAGSRNKKIYTREYTGENLKDELISDAMLFSDTFNHSLKIKNNPLGDIMLYQYQKYFLPEFVLSHTDRASMACSLEVRCPLLDKNIIEIANTLPLNLKFKNRELKRILFQLLHKNHFPKKVIEHKKQGFTFPVAAWLTGPLKHKLDELSDFIETRNNNIWNKVFIRRLIKEHIECKENNYRILWNLVVYSQWYRNYMHFIN